jgi:hypothetical protein
MSGSASHKRLFDIDEFSGTREIFHWDDSTETFAIELQQDVEHLLEETKSSFNTYGGPTDKWGDTHKVASIPMTIYQEWLQSGKAKDEEYIKKWLNDSDNAVFRTRPGRV